MATVLELTDVDIVRGTHRLLTAIRWRVQSDERWAVLGPNGSGKTTLCRLANLDIYPSHGTVDVLGQRLGRVDVRELRAAIGFTSATLAARLRPGLAVADVVVTGKHAALAPYWHDYTAEDRDRARALLERFGCGEHAASRWGTLSSGERQRALLARTLMRDPALLVLDEPAAGLDLGGREELLALLSAFAADRDAPATILVTHHVEEIPPGFTHVLLLREGRVSHAGPIERVLSPTVLSDCFGLPLEVDLRAGRWSATAATPDARPHPHTGRRP